MNRLSLSAIHLNDRLSQAAGRRCLYVRVAGSEQWELTIPVSARLYQVYDEANNLTTVQAYDWLIPVDDLPIKPRRGDTIFDMDAGRTYTLAPIEPDPSARFFDGQGVLWLVHTKLTGVDDE